MFLLLMGRGGVVIGGYSSTVSIVIAVSEFSEQERRRMESIGRYGVSNVCAHVYLYT